LRRGCFVSVLSVALLFVAVARDHGYGAEQQPVWWERAEALASRDGYRLVSLRELKALFDSELGLAIVDVRPHYEYKAGHIPGSVQMEFDLGERSRLKPDKRRQFETILGPDKGRRIVIYCRNYQWLRSEIAAYWAVRLGYTEVQRFVSGYFGWRDEGLPIQTK
jgi:rhodanese-related sulfurtransferase